MSKREKTPAIYSITNKINGRVYIGSSKNVTKRFRDYISLVHIVEQDPSKASRYNELIVDIVKYGWDNFEFKILDASVDMYDHELRAIREIEFITKYRSNYT